MASSVNLGPVLEKIVDNLVSNGRYNSRSEVLREGVRIIHEREARLLELDSALERGMADGQAGRFMELDVAFASIFQEAGLGDEWAEECG